MKLLNQVINELELIESSLNQDTPDIDNIRVDVALLLNQLHDEQAVLQSNLTKHFADDFHEGK
jgi:hypothetical protein